MTAVRTGILSYSFRDLQPRMASKLLLGIVVLLRNSEDTESLPESRNGRNQQLVTVLHEDIAVWAFLKHVTKL